jgi:hypothetical protein
MAECFESKMTLLGHGTRSARTLEATHIDDQGRTSKLDGTGRISELLERVEAAALWRPRAVQARNGY